MKSLVAISRCNGSGGVPYPAFPYAPGEGNAVHASVGRCFELLGLDSANVGSAAWNPLGEIIQPGQQVLIKPNWVLHRNGSGDDLFCVITHSSVVRSVLQYVLRALNGSGRVIIGDAPIQSADFELIMQRAGVREMLAQVDCGGVEVSVRDFRQNFCRRDDKGHVLEHVHLPIHDRSCRVDLGGASMLEDVSDRSSSFRVTNYDPAAMRRHHCPGRHEYLIARDVLESDVVLSLPKLKTHRKAGMTCCLKSVVGINASKDYLPHHRTGCVARGGDEYLGRSWWKAIESRIVDYVEAHPGGPLGGAADLGLRLCRRMSHHFASDPYSEGSWHGNDTVWRMALDLNRVLRYARADGTIADKPVRRVMFIVDAVLAGQGEGPLMPNPARMDAVLAGFDPAAVDACAARLAGLSGASIPLIRNALAGAIDGETIEPILVEHSGMQLPLDGVEPIATLKPPAGWAGHIELANNTQVQALSDGKLQAVVAEE